MSGNSSVQPDETLEVKFGLPREVEFCKRCIISNQRPISTVEHKHTIKTIKKTIYFEDGICDGCRAADKKKATDWAHREKELRDLCDRHRKTNGEYDCLVPGSGGKDSFYASHILKHKYNMHPLTVTWAPNLYTDWGWRNFQAWIHAGFDNYLCTPNGRTHRLLTRISLENLLHPFQAFMMGQKSVAPKLAIQFNCPLVFYGENETDYGNPIANADSAGQDWNYFTAADQSQIDFGGVSVKELKKNYGLTDHDLHPYSPANPEKLKKHKVEVYYLGYYLKWHPQGAYYYTVEHGGFQASPERNAGSYSKYSSIDDKIDDFHYYTMHVKFGVGRATDDAAQEVRNGEITREEGVSLVKRFDGEYPARFEKEIFEYLSLREREFPAASRMINHPIMDKEYFDSLADKFRSPHLWKKVNGRWQLRHAVWHEGNG